MIKTITIDDVPLLYTDFQGATVDASGKTIEVLHKAIEVLRRHPDGAWKLIVGDFQRPRMRSRHEQNATESRPREGFVAGPNGAFSMRGCAVKNFFLPDTTSYYASRWQSLALDVKDQVPSAQHDGRLQIA